MDKKDFGKVEKILKNVKPTHEKKLEIEWPAEEILCGTATSLRMNLTPEQIGEIKEGKSYLILAQYLPEEDKIQFSAYRKDN